jgi:predicted O-methyltransferase YrrM
MRVTQDSWSAVDRYISDHLVPPDPALDAALDASSRAGLPAINVSPPQGKMLMLLASLRGPKAILEIGTLGGYSTIWLARALLPGGKLVTLEYDPKHAEIARGNLARAGLADVVEIRVGKALDTLPTIAAEGRGPFDVVFIDADKVNNPNYVEWALKLSRPGTLVVVDNVIRDGKVLDAASVDPNIQGTRRLYELLAREPRLSATAIQTVGGKGYDGFVLALVKS